ASFLDPATLTPVRLDADKQIPGVAALTVRASANGQVFGFRNNLGGEPHTVSALVLTGSRALVYEAWIPGSTLVPSPDRRPVFPETGVSTNQLGLLFPKPADSYFHPYFPAHQGDFFMQIRGFDARNPGQGASNDLLLFGAGQDRPFLSLKDVEGAVGEIKGDR